MLLDFGHIIFVYLQHLVDFENLKGRDHLEDFGLRGRTTHFNEHIVFKLDKLPLEY
jgi:hypothetical protein